MSGWIKLHRSLIDWEWYTDHTTCRLFIHCLLRANHSDTKWRGQELKRGQFLTSLESLSNETGLSVSQIRTGFKKLKSTDEIASLSQARSRVITVLRYDQYQADDRLVAGSSQAGDSEIATDKNVITKECKKKDTSAAIAACPHQEIIDLYHEHLPELPTVVKSLWAGGQREKDLRARWKQHPNHQKLEFWERLFAAIKKQESTNWYFPGVGTGKWTDWSADLGWLLKRVNFDKTIERLTNG